jgi:hypothetical protein
MVGPGTPPPSPGGCTRLPRRAVLALTGVGALALAGCRIDPPSAPTADDTAPSPDTDSAVVAAVVATIEDVLAQAEAAAARGAAWAAPLVRVHLAHLAVLAPARGSPTAPPTAADGSTEDEATGAPRATRRRVLRAELRLQRHLATASADVSSGPLARALASASAGIAQAATELGGRS